MIVVFGSFSFFISGLDLFFFFLGYWNLFDNLGFGTLFLLEKEVEGVIELDFLGFFPIFSDFKPRTVQNFKPLLQKVVDL